MLSTVAVLVSSLETVSDLVSSVVVANGQRMSSFAYAILIDGYFTRDMQDYGPEDIHIFVMLACEWILCLNPRNDPPESLKTVQTIVGKMVDCAEHSLRTRTPNCGCYFDLPWLPSLWSARALHFPSRINSTILYLRLIHVLDQLHAKGLLTGPHTHLLPQLSSLVHEHYPTLCKDPECDIYAGSISEQELALNCES